MNQKLTKWFDPSKNLPSMPGWYERNYGFNYAAYDWFDGEYFYFSAIEEFESNTPKTDPAWRDDDYVVPWRGLAKNPNEQHPLDQGILRIPTKPPPVPVYWAVFVRFFNR